MERQDLVVAGRGVGDHGAAVGVADHDDRTLDRPQQRGDVRRIAAQLSRNGFDAPIARKPWPRSARIEPSKPLLSAHAP
jgi:hypothetical protein